MSIKYSFTLVLLQVCCVWANGVNAVELVATPAQLRHLEAQIESLQQEMHDTRTQYGKLQRQLQVSEEDIGEVAARLEAIHGELKDKQNSLVDLKKRKTTQEKQLETYRQMLAKQVRATYMVGRQDYLKLWLNQEDPAKVGRMLTYYDYFSRARVKQIDEVNKTLENITDLTQEIITETNELNQLVLNQENKKQTLASNYGDRKTILSQLEKILAYQDKKLKGLHEDKKRLEKLLDSLENVTKNIPQPTGIRFAKLKGKLISPVKGNIFKQFGEPLIGKLKWQGILINAKLGNKVQAIADGRVIFAQWFRHLGLLVIVDHNDSYMSLYAHNQSVYVKTGELVRGGDVIGSVGNSGGQKTTGLYFEIRHRGIPTNPIPWINKS